MNRLENLFQSIKNANPEDWWIKELDVVMSFQITEKSHSEIMRVYSNAIDKMDDESWAVLSKKSLETFKTKKRHEEKRGKDNFFNLLNEAFAYSYLVDKNYTDVKFIESNLKSPDISFLKDGVKRFCEVKTICESDYEKAKYLSGLSYDTKNEYEKLGIFMLNKLCKVICSGISQITASNGSGLIYLIIFFDDFTLQYYKNYKNQIIGLLNSEFPGTEIYIKVGINSEYFIHKTA